MSLPPPHIPTIVVDDAFKKKLANELPSMNIEAVEGLWWTLMPNAQRDAAGEDVDGRLYVCGMLVTEIRRRAYGSRSIERLHRAQVLANDMRQVADHLKYRAVQNDPSTRAASKGLYLP